MKRQPSPASSISRAQLRRLQTLWRQWTRSLHLSEPEDQALRHYYVDLLSGGRARETKELTRADARYVIRRLERLVREGKQNLAAGTAGRHDFPEQRRVRPNATAWRALWACARSLEMDHPRLDLFIRSHYAGAGLHSLADVRTMADLNRVLWGLKAMLRRARRKHRAQFPTGKRAA